MVTLITILHVFVCLFLILVVLLQAGKGGGMGLAFGSSGAQTVFGGSGAGNFMTKITAGTAVVFMLTSLTLAYFASARESAWLDDYEKKMSDQTKRDRAARDKLAPTPPDTGAPKDGAEGQTPASQPAGATDKAPEGAAPAPAATPEKAAAPVPAATDKAPAPAAPAKPAEAPEKSPAPVKPAP